MATQSHGDDDRPPAPPAKGGEAEPTGPEAATSAAGASQTRGGQVAVPAWLASDWPAAAAVAGRALGTMLAVGVAALVVLAVIGAVGPGEVRWSRVLTTPFSLVVGYLGAIDGQPVLLTGLVVLAVGLHVGLARVLPPGRSVDPKTLLAFCGKVGACVAAGVLVAAIVVDVTDLAGFTPGGRIGLGGGFAVDYVRAVLLVLPVAALMCAVVVVLRPGGRGAAALGLPAPRSGLVAAAAAGAGATLKVALVGLLALYALALTLMLFTGGGFGGAGQIFASLLGLLLLTMVLAAVDVAVVAMVTSMSLLRLDGALATDWWAWLGVGIVAAAFVVGGRRAADRAAADTQARAMQAGALVGVVLAAGGAVVAVLYVGLGSVQGLAAPLILLPLAWALLSAAGGWSRAREHGLPPGWEVSQVGQAGSISDDGADGRV